MANSTELQTYISLSQLFSSKVFIFIRWFVILLIAVGFGLFIFFIAVILNVFFTNPLVRDNARYVLFIYMLLNDAFFLSIGFCMVLADFFILPMPTPVCYVLYAVVTMTFKVTPCTLATMALEQYVAICYPLWHTELCTIQRANVAFTLTCIAMFIPFIAELGIMVSSFTNIFNIYVMCRRENMLVSSIQNLFRIIDFILCFTSVGSVILFTYVKITLVAKRARGSSSSANKAAKTVMLHAFQLLLSMSSLLSVITRDFPLKETGFMPILEFFVFSCMPRFLSPLIYGIKDELLRKYIKKQLPKRLR